MKYTGLKIGKRKFNMKAFLLAAGFGTRLRPLTNTVPKCLVPISGTPLLEIWLDLLLHHGVNEVLINTHYLHQQVHSFVNIYNKKYKGLIVREYHEQVLLGSGGTVKANSSFVTDCEDFFICYADNLTNIDLSSMLEYHHSHKNSILTMALFRTNKPSQCGIVSIDKDGLITNFIEKPNNPSCNLANAGVYIARKSIFKYFSESDFIDFGKDVLPKIVGKMYGWETHDYLLDVGTIENYKKANEEWNYDNYQNTSSD